MSKDHRSDNIILLKDAFLFEKTITLNVLIFAVFAMDSKARKMVTAKLILTL